MRITVISKRSVVSVDLHDNINRSDLLIPVCDIEGYF